VRQNVKGHQNSTVHVDVQSVRTEGVKVDTRDLGHPSDITESRLPSVDTVCKNPCRVWSGIKSPELTASARASGMLVRTMSPRRGKGDRKAYSVEQAIP
jgi:hypothetical protein